MKFVSSWKNLFIIVGIALIAVVEGSLSQSRALDIGPMTWTPRTDWINVKNCSSITGGPNAVGNGTTDDTTAIQDALNYVEGRYGGRILYFPAGTYKITQTLKLWNVSSAGLRGCGINSKIIWGGAAGGAMFWCNTTSSMRYIGLVWDGQNSAGCAYEENNSSGGYGTDIRHENESFRNFTAEGSYTYTGVDGTIVNNSAPGAAIISGFTDAQVTGEFMIYNCAFNHCTNGVIDAYQVFQNYMWHIDGCEFESCGRGVNFGEGGCYIVTNCHFENSSVVDVNGGFGVRVRHCTSIGAGQFYSEGQDASTGPAILEDCWIDSWKNTEGAIGFGTYAPNTVFDCTFTNPPSGGLGTIHEIQNFAEMLLSNNYAPDFAPGLGQIYGDDYQNKFRLVPPGARPGILTSPMQTFLSSAEVDDSTHIIDVTQSPYTADPGNTRDSTSTIQSAINAAATANNGSIVYIPCGIYHLTSTLTAGGGNYTIEGEGPQSELCLFAASGGTVLTISTPQNIAVKSLRFANLDNLPANSGIPGAYESGYPTADPDTGTAIEETSTGTSQCVYDDIYSTFFYANNPGAFSSDANSPGLVLSNLPSGSQVYMPHVNAPLTVQNCGAAQIFAKFLQMGAVKVSGTTSDTGFFGAQVAEGGQQSDAGANIVVNDNQSLVFGDYYSEQGEADIEMQRGSGTGSGHVSLQGFIAAVGNNNGSGATITNVDIDNYAGRLFYLQSPSNYQGAAVQITQSGSNPIDMLMVGDVFVGNSPPNFTLDSGAAMYQLLDEYLSSSGIAYMADSPSPQTAAENKAIAQGLDDLRQLEAYDLSIQFNIQQLVTNPSAELDTPNPSPSGTIGYNPAGWTIYNNVATGSGVRNFTVAAGASPFASGSQSMLWVDTTASGTGGALGAYQYFPASSGNVGAVETFDFRCNSSGTDSDLWLFTGNGPGIHITCNGSWIYFGGNIGTGGDSLISWLSPDVWYRVQIVLNAPSAGASNATLYLTPWDGNGPGATTSYTISGVQSTSSSGFGSLVLYSGAAPGASQSINIDNVSLTTHSQPFIPAATGTGSGM